MYLSLSISVLGLFSVPINKEANLVSLSSPDDDEMLFASDRVFFVSYPIQMIYW